MPRCLPPGAATALVAVFLALLASAPPPARAGSSSALSTLNAQRALLGFPGEIAENEEWSRSCALHNHYLARNGSFGHEEEPGKPGYTAEGRWAGEHSVLARAPQFTMASFLSAPTHLLQLLSPKLAEIGIAENDGFVCATTWPGYRLSGPEKGAVSVFTYPRKDARMVPTTERAAEEPLVPGTFVGLPEGIVTGPYLLVYAEGGWSGWSTRLVRATLRGPTGVVETRTIDRATGVIGRYVPPGSGLVIPVRPLLASRLYTARVTFRGDGHSLVYAWSFRTAPRS